MSRLGLAGASVPLPLSGSGPQFWGAVALLTALGYLANHLQLPLTFGVDFLLGSIFTLVAAALAGPRAGFLAALAASSYTWSLWHHPYAIVIFTVEGLWVGLAFRRGFTTILLSTSLYWLCLGMPLVAFFYGGLLGQDGWGTTIIVLKQAINGIFNALIADLVMVLLPLERWLTGSRKPHRFSFAHLLFLQTALLLLLPSLLFIRWANQREEKQAFATVANQLGSQARQTEESLGRWVAERVRAAQVIAELGQAYPLRPSARLQEELERIQQLTPDLHSVYLADARGKTVAFLPPINEKGEGTIGLDFSDRPYFRDLQRTLKPVISDVFPGRGGVFKPIFTISAPLVVEGRLAGYGLGAANLDKLKERLTYREDPRLTMTLLDATGQVLISTDPARKPLERLHQPPGLRSQPVAPGVDLNIPGSVRNKSILETWRVATFSVRRPVAGTSWTLLAEYPMAPLRDYFYRSTIRNLAWMGAWYLAALGLAFTVSRLLGRAPARLAELSQNLPARVEAGEAIVWPESQVLEMAQLMDNFRSVAHALALRIHEVRGEAARNLERERVLAQQGRAAAMGEMVGSIAHQWRQPLNALSLMLANLQDAHRYRELTDEGFDAWTRQGHELIQQMSATITDFIHFLRPEKEPVRFSLRAQVEEALRLVAPSLKHQQVTLEVAAEPEVFSMGHPNGFSQVLLYLLANAREATENAGSKPGRICITIARKGDQAVLTISDNGGGIRIEPIERIFEPYFSDKGMSAGIGLYLSRMILEQSLRGSITARNIPGGAEFSLTIPLAEAVHDAQ